MSICMTPAGVSNLHACMTPAGVKYVRMYVNDYYKSHNSIYMTPAGVSNLHV